MKPFLPILLVLTTFSSSFSQGITPNNASWEFHFVPLPALDFTPRWRVGVEYTTTDRAAISLDVGVGNSTLNSFRLRQSMWGNDYSFIEIRPEVKFLMKRTPRYSFYFSTEFFYITMRDVLLNDYYYPDDVTGAFSYDKAQINKTKHGLNFKAGIKFIAGNHLSFDFFGGIGFANRDIRYSDVVNPIVNNDEIFEEWWGGNYRYEGQEMVPSATLGVKIGLVYFTK